MACRCTFSFVIVEYRVNWSNGCEISTLISVFALWTNIWLDHLLSPFSCISWHLYMLWEDFYPPSLLPCPSSSWKRRLITICSQDNNVFSQTMCVILTLRCTKDIDWNIFILAFAYSFRCKRIARGSENGW